MKGARTGLVRDVEAEVGVSRTGYKAMHLPALRAAGDRQTVSRTRE